MRIFILLSRIPWPLEKGDKLRAFHQIRCLSYEHEIILCALNTDRNADKQKAFKALQPYCRSVNFIDLGLWSQGVNLLKSWIAGRPLQSGYFYGSRAHRRIKNLIMEYKPDVLYGQLLRVAEYLRHSDLPKALDYQDVFSVGMLRRLEVAPWYQKPFLRTEYRRLSRYETDMFDAFDLKTIISKPDRDLIPHPGKEEIMIVPNGVDQDFFRPMNGAKETDVVFTGNMAYPPNVNAAEYLVCEIMPLVWAKRPQTKVLLAGATPDLRVRALASEKVKVSGWLDDIRHAYSGASLFIAPMRIGTGLQNKLLEAMSMQLPCITTPIANKALGGSPGKHLLVGTDATELANHILELLGQPEFSERIAKDGYSFVLENYNWEHATAKLADRLNNLAEQHNNKV